jgi:type IV secretory pathway TrbD component
MLLALAALALFTGLIVGGGSRTTSVLLFGMLLVAVAFVLSQWAFELIDHV